MLEAIEADAAALAARRGLGGADARAGRRGCERLIVLSETPGRPRRAAARPVDRATAARSIPNGFDPRVVFARRRARSTARRRPVGASIAARRRPRGFDDGPVLLYVGRFTAVKRVPLLIEAYARARPASPRAPLVLVGGFPGEWEGEHPRRRDRAHGRAGRLPRRLARPRRAAATSSARPTSSCCPSVREQFGQVLVEGMACGLPAIAVDAHGPAEIVDHGETGWLVRARRPRRARRRAGGGRQPARRSAAAAARNAREVALERYAWPRWPRRSPTVYARRTQRCCASAASS